jgi:hypothetical protein
LADTACGLNNSPIAVKLDDAMPTIGLQTSLVLAALRAVSEGKVRAGGWRDVCVGNGQAV